MRTGKKSILILACIFCFSFLFSQLSDTQKMLRVKLWVPKDENPATQIAPKEGEAWYMPGIRALQETAPFFLTGMIYGWEFEYTPSDVTRNVEEYFSLTPIFEINKEDYNINFSDPAFLDARIYCWLEYPRTDAMMYYRLRWDEIQFPKVKGVGESGKINSVDAIKESVVEAAKNAIRTYAQSQTKNKPKEVVGKILLVDEDPSIKIISGKYTASLDFFLYVDKIIHYSQY